MPGFKIELRLSPLNGEQRKLFREAAKRWEEVILGAAVKNDASGDSSSGTAAASEDPLILLIRASGKTIDGPGRVLGRAGPTYVREQDGLPVEGIMEFDSADLLEMQQAGTLKDVILHVRVYACACFVCLRVHVSFYCWPIYFVSSLEDC